MTNTFVLFILMIGATDAPDDALPEKVANLFETRCVRCHNDRVPKGGLSLSTRSSLFKGGASGPAVEPGKPDESLLIEMIQGEKPLMPKQGDALNADELASITEWVRRGAQLPSGLVLTEKKAPASPWWAIQPLRRPAPPRVSDTAWPRTSIDLFILANLEQSGLRPSAEAGRRTLIRRLCFDLLGLPPASAEVDAFEHDTRPDAYERLVDRMLASPHYGERWARHWLDVAHYADTHGYDKDKRRDQAWPYRDYVIRSFNDDKPHDRFVREQLAGDVLWPGEPDAKIATGFIVAGPWDFVGQVELAEGTVEKEKTRVLDRDDMVANAMSAFTSLTVHCARCHDHKFDPISQNEYYQLQAVFAGVERTNQTFEPLELFLRREAISNESAALRAARLEIEAAVVAKQDPRLAEIDGEAAQIESALEKIKTNAAGPSPTNGYHSAIFATPEANTWVQVDLGVPKPIEVVRLIPARPTDFADTPGFGFPKEFRVEISDASDFRSPTRLYADSRPAAAQQPDVPLSIEVHGLKARYVRVSATRLWERTNDYVFALAELEVISQGSNIARDAMVTSLDSIESGRWSTRFLVDGFSSRGAVATEAEARLLDRSAFLRAERDLRVEQLTDEPAKARKLAIQTRLLELETQQAALAPPEQVYGAGSIAARSIHVLKRGEVEQPGDVVAPGALGCLEGLESRFETSDSEGVRRAAFANWVADERNVLTWRSIVNRVWQYHFGRGLVDTPNDFGRNGATPSHSELLDWLAVEFLNHGESIKHLHRLIVTSAAYRQASTDDAHAVEIDAENRLLWRQSLRRLEAEEIRDAVLVASGELDTRMFGPGFEVFRFKDDHSPIYDHEDKEAIVRTQGDRRAVYRFVVRSVPNPWIECLDGADPNTSMPVRNATISALQALSMLNDPFILRQSRMMARSAEATADKLRAQVGLVFQRALSRTPDDRELDALTSLAQKHGLAEACRLLFNLSEFVFVD